MTAIELQQRLGNAQKLRVFQADPATFYVESSAGNFCYRVSCNDQTLNCNCKDFTKHIERDQEFRCKHILAALQSRQELPKTRLDDRFIKNIQGKDFVLYAGLLDLAHQKGLHKIVVDAVQFPTKENGLEAICKAVIESKQREVFVEWGDANPNNTNRKIAIHILRMAATRAKARALRDFTNIGITCLEELGDMAEAAETPTPDVSPRKKPGKVIELTLAPEESPPAEPVPPTTPVIQEVSKPPSSGSIFVAQRKAIENLAARRGIGVEALEEMVQTQFGSSLVELSSENAAVFIRFLQKSA